MAVSKVSIFAFVVFNLLLSLFSNICIISLVLRKLQDFESPFITYKNMRPMGTKVVLRKSYWDTMYDIELLNDPIALNLLYTQTVAEIHAGWIPVTKELQQHLESLEKSGNKEEVRLPREINTKFLSDLSCARYYYFSI